MTNLEDNDDQLASVDRIQNSVIANSNSEDVVVTRQLFVASGAWINGKGHDDPEDAHLDRPVERANLTFRRTRNFDAISHGSGRALESIP